MVSGWKFGLSTALIVVVTTLLLIPTSLAEEQGDVSLLRNQLEQLESGVTAERGQAEWEQATEWLDEAEQLQSQGARRGIESRLRRVSHMVDLLRVLTEINDMEATIVRQREAVEESREQIEDLREDIESLEKQKQERQRELERLQRDG